MSDRPDPSPPADPASPAADITLSHAFLSDLLSPDLTLQQVADRHDFPLSDLAVLLSLDGPAQQLASLHLLAIERTRLLAASRAPLAIAALSAALEVLPRPDPRPASAPSSAPAAPREEPPLPPLLRIRRMETSRRAATTLLSLTRLSPPLFNLTPRCIHPIAARRGPQPIHSHSAHRDPPSAPMPEQVIPAHSDADAPRSQAVNNQSPCLSDAEAHLDLELPASQSEHTPTPAAPSVAPPRIFHSNLKLELSEFDPPLSPDLLTLLTACHEHWP